MKNSIFNNSSIHYISPFGGNVAGEPLFYELVLFNGSIITINKSDDIQTLHHAISDARSICKRNNFSDKIYYEILTELLIEEGW